MEYSFASWFGNGLDNTVRADEALGLTDFAETQLANEWEPSVHHRGRIEVVVRGGSSRLGRQSVSTKGTESTNVLWETELTTSSRGRKHKPMCDHR